MSTIVANEIRGVNDVGVLTPTRPAWACRLNNEQAANNYTNTDGTPVPFDHEEFDIGNNLTISLTDGAIFTAPITGIYTWYTLVSWQNVAAAGYVDLYMFVDGDQAGGVHGDGSNDASYRNIEDPQGGTYHTSNNSGLIQLNAGQTLTPHVRVSGDTSAGIRKGTRFSGFLVG
tara:strand:- start:354 stop:872 length:519 start_codon:yes stop_codon:yes gene_type:complete